MPDLSTKSAEELIDLAETARKAYQKKKGGRLAPLRRGGSKLYPGEPMACRAFFARLKHWSLLKAAAMDQGKSRNQLLREIIEKYLDEAGYAA